MIHNDLIQSEDAYIALRAWYDKFPEYGPGENGTNNPLFISGESYGGIYSPYLAWQIYQNNQFAKIWPDDTTRMLINLKGFIVGNGATDWNYDVMPSFPEVIKYFNLIPESIYNNYTDRGCMKFFNRTVKFDSDKGTAQDCKDIWE